MLKKLDRPLLAWTQESQAYLFDSAAHYAEFADEPGGLSPLEKKIAALPPRREWRMERIWTPDEESSEEHDAAYEKASVTIGGRLLHPRDLDSYATFAYEYAASKTKATSPTPKTALATSPQPWHGRPPASASSSSPSRTVPGQ
ncbi:hypothetical protein OH809_43130 [Streptomyces sp. NBC_00873]|uniref:hypothetical protein n=1 Tax=Streptomyces sp. NBC_00873 TaxID=2975852 RepID=UPI0038632748|nr:hypothetical protein OH809_00580 [Streptomyces sp. NBC_00873]WSY96832.1 hypothetical protein OH809_43130 [Streptomyces sp. NBC_00873]